MSMTVQKTARGKLIALFILRLAIAAVFLFAGSLKLVGAPAMIAVFEHVGLGQWFRYFTGVVEVSGAILLLTPRLVAVGAVLLFATMICAVLAHLIAVPGPPVPAGTLAVLTGIIAFFYRMQISSLAGMAREKVSA